MEDACASKVSSHGLDLNMVQERVRQEVFSLLVVLIASQEWVRNGELLLLVVAFCKSCFRGPKMKGNLFAHACKARVVSLNSQG